MHFTGQDAGDLQFRPCSLQVTSAKADMVFPFVVLSSEAELSILQRVLYRESIDNDPNYGARGPRSRAQVSWWLKEGGGGGT